MNVIIFVISFSASFLTNLCTAEYSVTGDHWGTKTNIDDLREYAKDMIAEWEDMVRRQDVEDMVAKYTDDSAIIFQGHPTAYGREAAKKQYQAWFDSDGVKKVDVDLKRVGLMGDDFLYLLEHVCAFNENDKKIQSSTMLVIFKKHGDGFEAFLKSVTPGNLSDC